MSPRSGLPSTHWGRGYVVCSDSVFWFDLCPLPLQRDRKQTLLFELNTDVRRHVGGSPNEICIQVPDKLVSTKGIPHNPEHD